MRILLSGYPIVRIPIFYNGIASTVLSSSVTWPLMPIATRSPLVPGAGHAATTLMRAAARERGFLRMTISTSRSSALSSVISRSTEKPSSL